jgi:O-antigen/teichoic acid export membrane protein
MEGTQINNRRIARNTAMVYFRMTVMVVVSLYTSRVVLAVLGVEDFGVYNVVGSVVALFSFLNAAMTSATQRFLNFELGRGDNVRLQKVFDASITIHIAIALAIALLSETIGIWFLNNYLNIPPGRMDAARWVLQFSILYSAFFIIKVPFNAAVIAHERMSFYAYMGVIEAVLKLLLVFSLSWLSFDKLKLYSVLTALLMFVLLVINAWYCYRQFGYKRYRYFFEKPLYQELVSFSGWSMLGGVANLGRTQLVNVLLNLFRGVAVNAAVGVANQVFVALNGFLFGFQTTFSPQIVKSYASGDRKPLFNLVCDTSRYSYFLMLLFVVPLVANMEAVLSLWLKEVPRYAMQFCSLTVIFLVVESLSYPLGSLIQATGRIRGFQIAYSAVVILNVPLSWALLRMGFEPYYTWAVAVLLNLVTIGLRMGYARRLAGFPLWQYTRDVLLVLVVVTVLAVPLPLWLGPSHDFWGLVLRVGVGVASVGAAVLIAGLRKRDRDFIRGLFRPTKTPGVPLDTLNDGDGT